MESRMLLSANGAAKALGLSPMTFRKYVEEGKIAVFGVLADGPRQVFDAEEVIAVKKKLLDFKPFQPRLYASAAVTGK